MAIKANKALANNDTGLFILGVKYILSRYNINGYELLNNDLDFEEKIYYNPFYLPIAFKYKDSLLKIDTNLENPFEYQNELYSKLIGKKIEIFKKINYETKIQTGNKKVIYEIIIPDGNFSIYGCLPWNKWFDAKININNFYDTNYTRWFYQTIFYIPTKQIKSNVNITITSENPKETCYLKFGQEQFYALDLDILKEITTLLKSNKADKIYIKNGEVNITVEANKDDNLYISIPYDKGWTILLNDKKIQPEFFADCMYSIKLTKGMNKINMRYHIPFFNIGFIISLFGFLLMFFVRKIEANE